MKAINKSAILTGMNILIKSMLDKIPDECLDKVTSITFDGVINPDNNKVNFNSVIHKSKPSSLKNTDNQEDYDKYEEWNEKDISTPHKNIITSKYY